MQRRSGSEAMRSFTTAFLQAEELGAPLAETLNQIALDMRRDNAQALRRKASQTVPRVTLVTSLMMVPAADPGHRRARHRLGHRHRQHHRGATVTGPPLPGTLDATGPDSTTRGSADAWAADLLDDPGYLRLVRWVYHARLLCLLLATPATLALLVSVDSAQPAALTVVCSPLLTGMLFPRRFLVVLTVTLAVGSLGAPRTLLGTCRKPGRVGWHRWPGPLPWWSAS